MRQAINIRLDKEVVQYLDDSAQILEKTRRSEEHTSELQSP